MYIFNWLKDDMEYESFNFESRDRDIAQFSWWNVVMY